ncbi:MAG: hypothetical protein ACRD3N_13625 [Terracidiphilus sp.]
MRSKSGILQALFLASICTLAAAPAIGQTVGSTFSFSNTTLCSLPVIEPCSGVAGTVTGKILGLPYNGTGTASKIIITSFPAGIDSPVSAPIIVTDWSDQDENSFTVTDGKITGGGFQAEQDFISGNVAYDFCLNVCGGYNIFDQSVLAFPVDGTPDVLGIGAKFTPVPEGGSALGFLLLAAFACFAPLTLRKKVT